MDEGVLALASDGEEASRLCFSSIFFCCLLSCNC